MPRNAREKSENSTYHIMLRGINQQHSKTGDGSMSFYSTGNAKFNVKDTLFDGAVGLTCGVLGGNGASYGNAKSICKAGVNLTKKILSGNGKQALNYYVKSAHRTGGDFVFSALKGSMLISSIGSAIITVKDYLKGLF